MLTDDRIDFASWRDSRELEQRIKEITTDPMSPWSKALKGYRLYRLLLHPDCYPDSGTEPIAFFLTSFSRPEEDEKDEGIVWVIVFELSSELSPRLASRARAAGFTVHGHGNESSIEVASRLLDTTVLPRPITTLLRQDDLDVLRWIDVSPAEAPSWECSCVEYSDPYRPDIKEFFLAIDVILNNANPELEKFVAREHWFPTLPVLLMEKIWAAGTSQPRTASGSSKAKKAPKTPVRDPRNKDHEKLLSAILSDPYDSYKKRLTELQIKPPLMELQIERNAFDRASDRNS